MMTNVIKYTVYTVVYHISVMLLIKISNPCLLVQLSELTGFFQGYIYIFNTPDYEHFSEWFPPFYLSMSWLPISYSSPVGTQLFNQQQLIGTQQTRRIKHVKPILKSLHWLSVSVCTDFKIILLVFKALHGLAPAYLYDMLPIYEPGRPLKSSGMKL